MWPGHRAHRGSRALGRLCHGLVRSATVCSLTNHRLGGAREDHSFIGISRTKTSPYRIYTGVVAAAGPIGAESLQRGELVLGFLVLLSFQFPAIEPGPSRIGWRFPGSQLYIRRSTWTPSRKSFTCHPLFPSVPTGTSPWRLPTRTRPKTSSPTRRTF